MDKEFFVFIGGVILAIGLSLTAVIRRNDQIANCHLAAIAAHTPALEIQAVCK